MINFNSLCEWFVDNKFGIHFEEDKTKLFLFTIKSKINILVDLAIQHEDVKIKKHSNVNYLGCIRDEDMSGQSMATNMIGKINFWIIFLHRKTKFLTHYMVSKLIPRYCSDHPN